MTVTPRRPSFSASAESVMRAAPVLSGRISGSECEVPSGNSASTPPAPSSARQRANVSSLRAASASRGR
jgi:hypothetical protein